MHDTRTSHCTVNTFLNESITPHVISSLIWFDLAPLFSFLVSKLRSCETSRGNIYNAIHILSYSKSRAIWLVDVITGSAIMLVS